MCNSLKVIIPVRSGSLRVKNKNLAPFAGSSLLEIKIRQLQAVSGVAEICVSSNDESMLALAADLGATPVTRDAFYATDTVPMSDVYAYMASQVESSHILLTHVTNPLVTSVAYERAIATYRENLDHHDSLTTVARVQEFLYLGGKALNYDPAKKPRSQDLPPIVRLTHAISILPRDLMIRRKDSMGTTPYFLELSQEESFDIDTLLDFEMAEFLYRKRHAVG